MAYDPTTAIGKVRRKAVDTVEPFVFSDAEVQAALDEADDSVNLAAADLLETRAASLLVKGGKIKILDAEIDTTQAAKVLREIAVGLREVEDESAGIAFAEIVETPAAFEERLFKQALRGAL